MENTGNTNEIREPYNAEIIFEFGNEGYFGVDGDGEFSITSTEGLILKFKPLEKDKSIDDRRKWQVSSGGFATEEEAADEGRRIVNMIHWLSITDKFLHPRIISPNLDRWSRADGVHFVHAVKKSGELVPENPAPVKGQYRLFNVYTHHSLKF